MFASRTSLRSISARRAIHSSTDKKAISRRHRSNIGGGRIKPITAASRIRADRADKIDKAISIDNSIGISGKKGGIHNARTRGHGKTRHEKINKEKQTARQMDAGQCIGPQ